jgi:uncharacterized membrane protein
MSATGVQGTPTQEIDPSLKLVLPGRGQPVGAGWTWVVEGWRLFARAPLMWILAIIVVFVIAVVVSIVPFIGSLAFQLLQGVFAGGFVVACRALEKGADFELGDLFAGFSKRFVPLLLVGVMLILGWIAILLVFMVFAGFSLLSAFMSGDPNNAYAALAASAGSLALGGLVALGLMVPLMAAYWFAPALVMMHDMKPVAAMKESFFACFRNFVPFLLYGFVMLVAAIVAAIPFGLGFLVWMPVAIASTYAAYRQIFTEG